MSENSRRRIIVSVKYGRKLRHGNAISSAGSCIRASLGPLAEYYFASPGPTRAGPVWPPLTPGHLHNMLAPCSSKVVYALHEAERLRRARAKLVDV